MAGGLDILIVGIAGENLDSVASHKRLRELFDEDNRYMDQFHTLVEDPTLANPKIVYLAGEHLCGFQIGAGLGYVIFDGNNNAEPRRLDEKIYTRIEELKQRFIQEVGEKGLQVPTDQVGIYALNVYDT